MASLSTNPIQGVGHGVLRPKLDRNFMVSFSANFTPTEDVTVEQAEKFLLSLSMQVSSVQLPMQIFDAKQPINRLKLNNPKFKPYLINGPVVINIEDDEANVIENALIFISRPDVIQLTATVAVLDGEENVLQAFFFGSCKIKSIGYGFLDYASRAKKTTVIEGVTKDLSGNETGIVELKAKHDSSNGVFMKQLSLTPIYTQKAIFDANEGVTINSIKNLL